MLNTSSIWKGGKKEYWKEGECEGREERRSRKKKGNGIRGKGGGDMKWEESQMKKDVSKARQS